MHYLTWHYAKQLEIPFLSNALRFLKEQCFLEDYQASPVSSCNSNMHVKMSTDTGGMIHIWKNRSTTRKPYTSATFSTTILTQTGMGLNPDLLYDRPATNGLSLGKALIHRRKETVIINIQSVPGSKHPPRLYKPVS